MIVKRKLFSFIDEEGNLGYYLYNEATGEEKLFSIVEEEREFASVRHIKKIANSILEKSAKGKLTTKDAMRQGRLKGVNSLRAIENPNYDKSIKGAYNKLDKLTKGKSRELISKPEYINMVRAQSRKQALTKKENLNKGDIKFAVDYVNQLKYLK